MKKRKISVDFGSEPSKQFIQKVELTNGSITQIHWIEEAKYTPKFKESDFNGTWIEEFCEINPEVIKCLSRRKRKT